MKGLVPTSIFLFFTIMGCASQQKLMQTPPFKINNPTFRMVISGQEASSNQMELRMDWEVENGQNVIPDTIYFRDRATMPYVESTVGGNLLVGRFTIEKQPKADLIMHANPLKEVGNQPTLPLHGVKGGLDKITESEAILSYRHSRAGERFYYRITGIVEKQPLILPSRPH